MRIPLDRESSMPLYQQIAAFLKKEIECGALAENTRLPSSRDLADSVGVNRITINNAYAELEAAGLIYRRLGSGTYVARLLANGAGAIRQSTPAETWPQWQHRLKQISRLSSQDNFELAPPPSGSDFISFSRGVGSGELFPVDEFRKSIQSVLSRDRTDSLTYGPNAGYLPLRNTISHILADQGILTSPDSIIVTSGSQQALWLVSTLLLRAGDTVLLEAPTYPGTLSLLRALGARAVGVPVDQDGMRIDLLEAAIEREHPRLIYTIPTFHNPTGACLSSIRRRQLIALAGSRDIPVLEDEFVGDLRYEGHAQPALKALDPDGRVIYISTFSKILMPGLRVGYIVAHGPVYEQLLRWKYLNDIATANLMQRALEAYINVGRYQAHLHRARRVYRRYRDAMVSALRRHMPAGAEWNTPQGGLFIWLRLPEGLDSDALYPLAVDEGVDFAPGSLFYADERKSRHLRLNFSELPESRIDEGIRRLARAVQRCLTG
ncbi:MAG TPA: PLP-dependent aminotransferase family protein [Anaerolineaceae bacterium]